MKIINGEIKFSKDPCIHIEECKVANQVLFYLDECQSCEVAEKFRKHQAD